MRELHWSSRGDSAQEGRGAGGAHLKVVSGLHRFLRSADGTAPSPSRSWRCSLTSLCGASRIAFEVANGLGGTVALHRVTWVFSSPGQRQKGLGEDILILLN
jgi:hypothetical protein